MTAPLLQKSCFSAGQLFDEIAVKTYSEHFSLEFFVSGLHDFQCFSPPFTYRHGLPRRGPDGEVLFSVLNFFLALM